MLERFVPEQFTEQELVIYGQGEIGDKANQLKEKSNIIREIGFRRPQATILAEDFFDDFFSRNNLGANLKEASNGAINPREIINGTFTEAQFKTLASIGIRHGNRPLVVRSSAKGDARGTGTYLTEVVENHPGKLRKTTQRVLASYFTEDAVEFRKHAQTGEGFGIQIETLEGMDFENFYAPVFSGYGYTSTARGEGYINIVPGFGGGVDTRDGDKLTATQMAEYEGKLHRYRYETIQEFAWGHKPRNRSALFGDGYGSSGFPGKAFYRGDKHFQGGIYNTHLDFEGDLWHDFHALDLTNFFTMIAALETAVGRPQYFEWALTFENTQPIYWLNQIADVDKKLDSLDFGEHGEVLFNGHMVLGTADKVCSKIVVCWNSDDIAGLYQFNKQNTDYVLVFSSRLISRMFDKKLTYADFSNAAVFLEIEDMAHAMDPIAHFQGQLDVTGKLFATMDSSEAFPQNWELFRENEEEAFGLNVYNRPVRVIASERQNRLVVYS